MTLRNLGFRACRTSHRHAATGGPLAEYAHLPADPSALVIRKGVAPHLHQGTDSRCLPTTDDTEHSAAYSVGTHLENAWDRSGEDDKTPDRDRGTRGARYVALCPEVDSDSATYNHMVNSLC